MVQGRIHWSLRKCILTLKDFKKKWFKFEFIATVHLFLKVLNEMGQLCYVMEAGLALIQALSDAVDDVLGNLNFIKDNNGEVESLPKNTKKIKVTGESENLLLCNTVKINPEVHNISVEKSHKLNKISEVQIRKLFI